jgi:hypothetical protein
MHVSADLAARRVFVDIIRWSREPIARSPKGQRETAGQITQFAYSAASFRNNTPGPDSRLNAFVALANELFANELR